MYKRKIEKNAINFIAVKLNIPWKHLKYEAQAAVSHNKHSVPSSPYINTPLEYNGARNASSDVTSTISLILKQKTHLKSHQFFNNSWRKKYLKAWTDL